MSMEFLIKHMGLENQIAKLGLSTQFKEYDMPINEKEISRINEELKSNNFHENELEKDMSGEE
jgi:hypothetical protein